MKIKLDDLDVYFPFKHIYREQAEYLLALKKIFSSSPTNTIIQVPPALSKATCVFAFYVSLYLQNPATIPRLIFSAKSVPEFEHAMTTLRLVIDYIEKDHQIKVPLLALCISEKKNLCINDAVAPKAAREVVNYECNKRIAPWTRQRHKTFANGNQQEIESDPALCRFYEGYIANQKGIPEITGCHSLESLKEYGKKHKVCPYYLAEELFPSAQIILCDYFMLFGMKKSNNFDRKILEGAFLVIDECCGLDDDLSEMFTERVSRISLDHALKCVEDLNTQLKNIKEINPKRFDEEYDKLMKGLTKDDLDLNQINKKQEKAHMNNFDEGGDEIMNTEKRIKFPGYIRKPEHFITHLKKFILFLKGSITKNTSKIISHVEYLERYLKETLIDSSVLPLAYFPTRMRALINFLQNSEIESEQFMPLHALLQFAHIFGTFGKGFEVILYSLQEANLDVNEISLMILSLACLDPAEPFGQITANIGSLLLHTETLTEVDMFAGIMELHEHPNLAKLDFVKIDMHSRLKLMPIIVNKGADQIELSTEHARRNDAGIMRNYSNMIVRLSEAVPDGILCMFPNIRSLKHIGLDFYEEILENKLIFAESIDVEECSKSVSAYVQACERGRGGVFMGLMRGHVLGHLAFDNKTAKCVIVFGIPLEYSRPREFLARTRYLKVKKQIQESDYIVYSIMKEVCKPLGKLIRKREDSCVIIFADKRFLQADKVKRLPYWIEKQLENGPNQGLPSDQASYRAARFYKACENEKDWEKYDEDNISKLFDKLNIY